jgi:sigma-B regulation protein RsbU (phosphoserine phosphatase)
VTQKNLKRILSRGREVESIVYGVIGVTNTPIAVWDQESNLLLGSAGADSDRILEKHSILCDGEVVGWVTGGDQAELIAAMLTHLVAREAEKEELLDEILDLYRQVNLLFNLSEKLSASLELNTVARTILDEASRLIEATGGAVVLLHEEQAPLTVATIGQGIPAQLDPGPHGGIVGAVVAGERAEIINDVRLDTRYAEGRDSIRSLLCAPLTSKNKAIGAIVIVSQVPVTYTAADLNLLNTLASQAAPAIENAVLYERTLREAQEREKRLRQQVQELRIELDEARQKEKVAEITGSEYYQRLRDRADTLRSIIGDPGVP